MHEALQQQDSKATCKTTRPGLKLGSLSFICSTSSFRPFLTWLKTQATKEQDLYPHCTDTCIIIKEKIFLRRHMQTGYLVICNHFQIRSGAGSIGGYRSQVNDTLTFGLCLIFPNTFIDMIVTVTAHPLCLTNWQIKTFIAYSDAFVELKKMEPLLWSTTNEAHLFKAEPWLYYIYRDTF